MKFIALVLAAIIGFASAQEFLPEPQYYGDILGNGERLADGNGIKYNAEYGLIVATYRSGSIRAYNARTLDLEWERPASDFLDGSTFSRGGVSFGTASGQDFVTYGISTGTPYQAGTECYVIGLDMQGNNFFQSGALTGQCSGSPVASGIMNAGAYVFVTSSVHVEPRSGHFSVVETGDGSTFYTYESPIDQPMSPVGCNGEVSQGYYLGGELNSQDMCVFAHAPYNGEEVPGVPVNVANTAQFGYQPPMVPNTDAPTSVVTLLGLGSEGLIDYFTKSAPVITDTYTMVMQISRSQTAMWAGISALIDNDKYKANRFDKVARNRPSAKRGTPPSLGSFSSAAVDSNGAVYVSAAALEIKAWLEPELNSGGLPSWNHSYVAGDVPYTGVVLSPDESRLYYQLGRSGTFSCLFTATGELCHENFAIPGGVSVWGDFEVSAEGIFYVGDISGTIHSFQLMEPATLDPTASPTPPPTPAPMEVTIEPMEPSGVPTTAPSSAPGDSTPPPTDAPNPTPTPARTSCLSTTAATADRVERLLAAKRKSGLSYDELAQGLGVTNTYAAQLLLGQARLTPTTAEKLKEALPDLDVEDLQAMQDECPMRGFDEEILKEPNVYRTYEAITHYGQAIKSIINEQCGDGIMSAIDFYLDVGTTTGKHGEKRVVITFNGKFLPFIEQKADDNGAKSPRD